MPKQKFNRFSSKSLEQAVELTRCPCIYICCRKNASQFETMLIYPSIEQLGGRVLCRTEYYDAFLKGEKNVEISVLKTRELVKPRVPYSHFILHLGRRVVQNRQVLNLLCTNLGTVGPFCSAHSAWIAAKQSGLKLGMGLRELERFMTRMRKDRKTGRKVPTVVLIVFHTWPRAGRRARQ